jgi:NAD(P)-dependent dehydrogenase (short-subunit alcohol dehydrogenase family)
MTGLDFTGQTAVVTGGSRGIGLEIARELLASGARVVITGRKQPALDTAASDLGDTDSLFCLQANAGDLDASEQVVQRVMDRFGSIDLLVNNVGISPYFGPLMDAPADVVTKTFEVNVVGGLAMVQSAWKIWMKAYGGAIVNVSSIGARHTASNLGAYALTKAALENMTRQLSVELAPHVRVNAVAPAMVRTDFSEARYAELAEALVDRYPLQRLGVPADIAPAACFLLSDQAAWITGETISIDGGTTKVDTG